MKKTFETEPGSPLVLGTTMTPEGVNFALFSRNADKVWLVLFYPVAEDDRKYQSKEIPLDPALNKTGDIWHILVRNLSQQTMYVFRADGPHDPHGKGHYFDRNKFLLDPYARAIADGERWGLSKSKREKNWGGFTRRGLIVDDHFDWQGDRPLNIPLKDSIIYELHVRSFTIHPTSGVRHPGTFKGIIEKIPYLQELGITAVELMPVTEFNENENVNKNPKTGERLKNLWGYSPLCFFAPKASYAVNGLTQNQVHQFKEMVKSLHSAGIEVILDVVFNHTAESGGDGPVISFRGLDNSIYYLLDPITKEFLNFSGCGNTLNCNHPLVRTLIMDCLRYWVVEMHIDGFRFDLASILGRDQNGEVMSDPPMIERIAEDPILANTKIIAEAWDAAGVYQVGNFSPSSRWAEWNGKFRDDVRAFMCGFEDTVSALATRIAGSADLYQRHEKHPFNSINFITSHDGFTLYDLVSYNHKYNLDNGENNSDGSNNNISWNSGKEGETTNLRVIKMRERRMRTMLTILFLSQGVPMFGAGEEFGRTQAGNNNAYCQDNPIGWVDWSLHEKKSDLFRFFKELIALRKRHPVFRRADFFPDPNHGSRPEIRWQSTQVDQEDWSSGCKTLAFFLDGQASEMAGEDDFFVMMNGNRKTIQKFSVPTLTSGKVWRRIIDTAAPPPNDFIPEHKSILIRKGTEIKVAPMGAVVLISKSKKRY